MPTGRAIRISPAHKRNKEAYLPILTDFKLHKPDLEEQKWSESRWHEIRQFMINQKSNFVSDEARSRQFEERRQLAESMFPLPPELQGGNNKLQNPFDS